MMESQSIAIGLARRMRPKSDMARTSNAHEGRKVAQINAKVESRFMMDNSAE
jgi:hypothetical protein